MESANAIVTNNSSYTTHIRVYFYKDHKEQTYNMVIVGYDNNRIEVSERKSFQVLIDFIPEDFIEYEFDVVEATSTYLHVTQLGNKFMINFTTESKEENYEENVFEYEPECCLVEHHEVKSEANIIWEKGPTTNESDNEINCYDYSDGYDSADCYDSADGYDSEGYYFRC